MALLPLIFWKVDLMQKVDSGLFRIKLIHPSSVERGHTARFKAVFEHVDDGLIDPAGLTLKIYEGSTLRSTNTPVRESAGVYYYDYTVLVTDGTGPKVAEWNGTYSTKQITARSIFRVRRTA